MHFNTVLFDLDGVIIDSEEWIVKSIERACKEFSYTGDARRAYVPGKPFLHVFQQVFPERKNYDDIIHYAVEEELKTFHLCKLFPSVKETLSTLKKMNVKTGIVTSRGKQTTQPVLDYFSLEFDCVVTFQDVRFAKPHPEPINTALKLLSVQPQDSVYVGDTKNDIIAAKSAGVKSIAALYGYEKGLLSANPDYCINRFDEVMEIIG